MSALSSRQINRRTDGPSHAARALKRRLKSDNPKILQLTLTLCEAVMKNCDRQLHQALGTREFLAEVAALGNGQRGYEVVMFLNVCWTIFCCVQLV